MAFEFLAFAYKMIACLVCGGIVGYERERMAKPAGISTITLVMTGAMIFTYLSSVVDTASMSRIAAQVVTGVGFLGAGIILRKENGVVRNLTTAASIWFAAAIGMLIGYGHLGGALLATVFVVGVIMIPRVKPHPNARGKHK